MPRQPRLDIPGLLHHVMARGIEGRDIFRLNRERDESAGAVVALISRGHEAYESADERILDSDEFVD
jgi:hypothetical protein